MTISINECTTEIDLLCALRSLGEKKTSVIPIYVKRLCSLLLLVLVIYCSMLLLRNYSTLPCLHDLFIPHGLLFSLQTVSAILIGLIAGVLPAKRAAKLDRVEALRSD